MKICAIDSSGLVASVAILDGDGILAEYSIQHKITHSQTLLPMLDDVCRRVDMDLNTIDAYAYAAGPGSFTGLRIGAATIKGLGIAIDRPVVSIPTLESLAWNLYGSSAVVCPIMDARRHQVYTAAYSFELNGDKSGMKMTCIIPQCACAFEDLCDKLNNLGKEVIFVGDGIPVYEAEMPELLNITYSLAPAHMNRQRAASLASLAKEYLCNNVSGLEGVVTTADETSPVYLRMSQAEREKKEREGEA